MLDVTKMEAEMHANNSRMKDEKIVDLEAK